MVVKDLRRLGYTIVGQGSYAVKQYLAQDHYPATKINFNDHKSNCGGQTQGSFLFIKQQHLLLKNT